MTEQQTEPTEQPERIELSSLDVAEARRQELLRVFPEAHAEGGKVDFDRLKLALGESVEEVKERYGLAWPGKTDCFKTIQAPSMGTLRPMPNESVNWDTTENVIIEGDNLEVLKLLQKSYLGKVKMIYIDPPFNTGQDFIYPDDFSESLDTYLRYTGQVDDEGRAFGTNLESDGRFHSKWMSMMYPRLYLARNLLREDGVIFISIDDNEYQTLKAICAEIFGEESFVSSIVVKMSHLSGMKMSHKELKLPKLKQYILVYARNRAEFVLNPIYTATSWDQALARYTSWLEFEDRKDMSTWRRRSLSEVLAEENPEDVESFMIANRSRIFRTAVNDSLAGTPKDNQFREVTTPTGLSRIALNGEEVVFAEAKIRDVAGTLTPVETLGDLWIDIGINNLHKEGGVPFPNGKKPLKLVERLLELATSPGGDDLVLDFFAGSGTTGEAVLRRNRSDGGSRRFILAQLPEPLESGEDTTVMSLLLARMRGVVDQSASADEGFRVFRLDESSFRVWQGAGDSDQLTQQVELHVEHIRDGRTSEDLLNEILLKSGFPLSVKITDMEAQGATVYFVGDGALAICLADGITLDLIRAIGKQKPERVVLVDRGFEDNDQLKANAVQIFRAAGVTSFKTV